MDEFMGSIKLFAGTFAPRSWMYCDGQILAISQYTALFSILGTTYGGDGRTSFALPDLRSRVPIGPRTGPGLQPIVLGQKVGSQENFIGVNNLPAHTHNAAITNITATGEATVAIPVTTVIGNTIEPDNTVILSTQEVQKNTNEVSAYSTEAPQTTLKPFTAPVAITGTAGNVAVGNTGSNIAINNIQPSLGLNYIICIEGLYPSRS